MLVVARGPLYPIHRRLRRAAGFAVCAAAAASVCGVAAARADLAPALSTDRACYLVGQTVQVSGAGFDPYRTFVVSIDGVFLGHRTTDSGGSFFIPLHPGGLPAGAAQHLDLLEATDGTMSAQTSFVLTRSAGFRITDVAGGPRSLTGRFQIWGFSLAGVSRPVYVHYIAPSGKLRKTVSLGTVRGACGYLRTSRRRVFPFSVSPGKWTLQVDTQNAYSRFSVGPRVRIRVVIS